MIKNVLRKIYRTLFPVQEVKYPPSVIGTENSVSIQSSALLMPSKNGKIVFGGNNYVGRQVELGTEGLIEIGYGTTIQDRCILLGDVELGKFCTFAPNVYISSGRHYFDYKPNFYIKDQDEMVHSNQELAKQHSKKVTIEDDVWIGINSVIMSGIKIGRGAVIGSNSVVTKDVPPYTVVGGQPAKEIKKRLDFSPKSILNFNLDDDLPHFYQGVYVDMKNVFTARKEGGLATCPLFILHLKEGSKVELTIKKTVNFSVRLNYNGQMAELTNEFSVYTLDMAKGVFHRFFAGNVPDEKVALIKEVKVIS